MAKRNKPVAQSSVELRRIRTLWQNALLDRSEHGEQLLDTLLRYQSADAFVRALNQLKVTALDETKSKKLVVKKKTVKTPWEKARSTLTTARVHLIGGGLPSLGKRSK